MLTPSYCQALLKVEPQNALLDNRDRLIDELSKTLEVTVTYTSKNAAL